MKLKYTPLQIFLEAAGIALIAGMVLLLVFNWSSFPERIPTHFGISGQADAWGSKSGLLFLPILGIVLYGFITLMTFFPAAWNMNFRFKEENKVAVYQTIKTMMMVLKIAMVGIFLYIFYFQALGQSMPGYFLPVVLVALFVPILLFILHARKVGNKQEGEF